MMHEAAAKVQEEMSKLDFDGQVALLQWHADELRRRQAELREQRKAS
jgi:hypothetical protein